MDVVKLTLSIRRKDPDCKIAIITPYKAQKWLFCNSFLRYGINYRRENIAIDTIDSFQGSESDVVIFCTTRSAKPTLFFRDNRRINVALSRAKRELIILGKLQYFYKFSQFDSCMPDLADFLKKHGNIVSAASCPELSEKLELRSFSHAGIIIPLEKIHLPSAFYLLDLPYERISAKIEEYNSNSDFINPFKVKKSHTGYQLIDCFDQFLAAQELNLAECRCLVVPD